MAMSSGAEGESSGFEAGGKGNKGEETESEGGVDERRPGPRLATVAGESALRRPGPRTVGAGAEDRGRVKDERRRPKPRDHTALSLQARHVHLPRFKQSLFSTAGSNLQIAR